MGAWRSECGLLPSVRRLNEEGVAAFRDWIEAGAEGAVPSELLADTSLSEAVKGGPDLEQIKFDNRFELGNYLTTKLKVLEPAVRFDAGVWDWISLLYFDQLCPESSSGDRDPKETVRYVLEFANRKWSRHIVRMSWMAVRDHGVFAQVLLSTPLTRHSDVMEQLAGRQEVFGSAATMQVAFYLYWDSQNSRLKTGAQGKKAGTPRRLRRFLSQIRRTYDPNAMTAQQLTALLPDEFNGWKT